MANYPIKSSNRFIELIKAVGAIFIIIASVLAFLLWLLLEKLHIVKRIDDISTADDDF